MRAVASAFAALRATHLILLVGTNPLPNFVAATLLRDTSADFRLCLVTSPETVSIAGRLIHSLELSENKNVFLLRIDDVADLDSIALHLGKFLNSTEKMGKPERIKRVHLHYTGGTKPMSIAARDLLQAWATERGIPFDLSYLDPRTLALRVDGQPNPIRVTPDQISLSFWDIAALHGWEKEKPRQPTPLATQTDSPNEWRPGKQEVVSSPRERSTWEQLIKTLDETAKVGEWRAWCDRWLRAAWTEGSKDKKNLKRWQRDWRAFQESSLGPNLTAWANLSPDNQKEVEALVQWVQTASPRGNADAYPDAPVPIALSETNEPFRQWLTRHLQVGTPAEALKQWARFLDAMWLERLVFQTVCTLADEFQIHHVLNGVEMERVIKTEDGDKTVKFELDVVAMRGYQLHAISVTTDVTKALNKSKLFEAYTRARQLGGDEARVALVGAYHDATQLLHEVQEEWQTPRGMIRVFGWQHWKVLEQELRTWFESNQP